jgi:hypothetical protein
MEFLLGKYIKIQKCCKVIALIIYKEVGKTMCITNI